jgi:hypothetical protein
MFLDGYYFNLTSLCGRQKFVIWDNDINDFGECFLSLVLVNFFLLLPILSESTAP